MYETPSIRWDNPLKDNYSSVSKDIFNTMNTRDNMERKEKIYRLISTLAKIYNEKNPEKITESKINQLVEDLSRFDAETIMDSLILRIMDWINTWEITRDEVLSNLELLLDIDPENFKSIEDLINRHNYLKMIWLDKVKITKNCSEILKENHEHIYELFDNFNILVNNQLLSWLDYWYTWWLVGYLWTDSALKRYHWDVDIYLNVEDLERLKWFIEDHKELGFRFIDNLKNKGTHGHEYMIMYKDNPLHIWLFLFRKKNDTRIERIEYDLSSEWELLETVSWEFPYEVETWEYNTRQYRRESLQSLIEYKKNSTRPKDKYDVKILEKYFSSK